MKNKIDSLIWSNKGFFSETEATYFANLMKDFWPRNIAVQWFWFCYAAFEKAGFTYYEDDESENIIRIRLLLISLSYIDLCSNIGFTPIQEDDLHRSSQNGVNFIIWKKDIGSKILKDLSEDSDELIETLLCSNRNAVIDYCNCKFDASVHLWLNVIQGNAGRYFSLSEIKHLYEEAYTNLNITDPCFNKLQTWFIGGHESIESIRNSCIHYL